MDEEATIPAGESAAMPSMTPGSLRALGATRRWARFAGTALFGLALLKLVAAGLGIAHLHGLMNAGQMDHATGAGRIAGTIIGALVEIGVYCATGAFALRYAGRLGRVRPPWRPGPSDIASALGAQHRYWRLQGVVTLIGLGFIVLAIVLMVLGLMLHVAAR